METILLASKVRIPPRPSHAVLRTRLTDALERAVPDYKLILISAPAGYGKTTLLTQWAHSSQFPVAWLSVGEEDNNAERFLRYLLAAWEEAQPGVKESSLGHLLGAQSPNIDAVLSAFINVANDAPRHVVIVLDDYQLVEDPAIHQSLTFLLDHLPPLLHFVIVGRGEPPLPVARYRARDEAMELRTDELQFVQTETADFLKDAMRLDVSEDEVVRLHSDLEGWIAGLQLVALTLRQRLRGAEKLVVSGRHRFIADYLSEDVLAPLDPGIRQFLLETSILDRLCGSLCEAVTGTTGGQDTLEALERENLFLVPLDDSREWFRYHRLFADFLYEELKRRHPNGVGDLHRRAARWYLAHDMPEPAFQHALEGDDVEIVVQILDRYVNAKLWAGEFNVLTHWLDSLPPAWYTAYPILDLARAGPLFFSGAFDACMRVIDNVEQRLQPAESGSAHWQVARVAAVRCFVACATNDMTGAEALAQQALGSLLEEDLSWRPGVYTALGDTYRQNGRWDEAKACYLKAQAVTNSPQYRFMSTHAFGALADLALRQGLIREADGYWRKALSVIQDQENWGRLELPVIGWVYIRLGELLHERNELVDAWVHLSQGMERAELGGDVRALIAGYLIAGRIKLSEGDVDSAVEYLERARPLVEQAPFPDWTSRFERFQLEVWLAQDRLREAVDWVDVALRGDALEARPESEAAQLTMARVLIAKGDAPSIERARKLLERLLQAAEAEGRMGVAVEALALEALADWRRGESAGAMTSLERALRLAEPEGYVRLFVDLGLPMARLLQEARSRAVMPDYIARLLASFGADLPSASAAEQALPEPLTQRQQEILELLAAGLTNQEIANKLVISPETVKKHTGTIYEKLSVSSRTEAVARARALDLLE